MEECLSKFKIQTAFCDLSDETTFRRVSGYLVLLTTTVPFTYSVPDSFFSDRLPAPRPLPSPPGFFPTRWSDLYSRAGIRNHPFLSPFRRDFSPVNDTLSLIYSNFSPRFPEVFNETDLIAETYRKQRETEESLLSSAVDFPFLTNEETSNLRERSTNAQNNATKDVENAETVAIDQVVYSDEETQGFQQKENDNTKEETVDNESFEDVEKLTEIGDNERADRTMQSETATINPRSVSMKVGEEAGSDNNGRQVKMQLDKPEDKKLSESGKPDSDNKDAEDTRQSPYEEGNMGTSFGMNDKERKMDDQNQYGMHEEEKITRMPKEEMRKDYQRDGIMLEGNKEENSSEVPSEETRQDNQSENDDDMADVNKEEQSFETSNKEMRMENQSDDDGIMDEQNNDEKSFKMLDEESRVDNQSADDGIMDEENREENGSKMHKEEMTMENQEDAGTKAEKNKEENSPQMTDETIRSDYQSEDDGITTEMIKQEMPIETMRMEKESQYDGSTFDEIEKGKSLGMYDEGKRRGGQSEIMLDTKAKEMKTEMHSEDTKERNKVEIVSIVISKMEEEKEEANSEQQATEIDQNGEVSTASYSNNNEIDSQNDVKANIIIDPQKGNKGVIRNKTKTQILPEGNPGELLNSDLDVIQDHNATSFFCSPDNGHCMSKTKSILLTTGILIGIIVGLVTVVGLMTGLSVYTFHHWKLRSRGNRRSRSAYNVERPFSPTPHAIKRPLYEHKEGTSQDNDSPLNTLEAITVDNYRERAI